jgi:hypothetical protein
MTQLSIDTRDDQPDAKALIVAMAVFALLSALMAVMSQGFLEADGVTHYLFARYALREPQYLVNVWGRPLFTALYALPAAWGGLVATRAVSLLLALGCALITWRVARLQQHRLPAIAVICLLAQPLFFLHSFSELTELPFATALIAAFGAYAKRQWCAMAMLAGVLPLGRPEGFGFIGLAAVALIAHRRWWWCFILPLPLVAWSFAGWVISERPDDLAWWQWLVREWPYSAQSAYGRGHALAFVARLPVIASPLLFPFMLIGITCAVRSSWRSALNDHRRRCELLIALIPLMILIGHSVLWWGGWMASNGELRYLLIVAPFWAMLATRGFEWAWSELHWPRPMQWAGILALLPGLINFYYPVLPLPLHADALIARDVAGWYQQREHIRRDYPRVMSSPPMLFYFLDRDPSDSSRAVQWSRERVAAAPDGTLLVWDPIFGPHNADHNLVVHRSDILAAGWIHLGTFRRWEPAPTKGQWQEKSAEIFLSPRTIGGARP